MPLFGAEVRIADAAGLLAAVDDGPVELLVDGDFPAPVREVRCTVRADTAAEPPVYRFEAYLRVEAAPAGLIALGLAGPVGVLLAERLAARGGDGPAAAVGRIAAEAGRRIWPRPVATLAAPPGDEAGREVLRVAREAGLRPRVDQDNGTVRIRADVPSAEVGPAHLRRCSACCSRPYASCPATATSRRCCAAGRTSWGGDRSRRPGRAARR
ncbi:hypothetical protein V2I01_41415 [Micromonospora sp. BRA006-A]|nr:hypothetical protein [Micromonospora sp. BRA006-A]